MTTTTTTRLPFDSDVYRAERRRGVPARHAMHAARATLRPVERAAFRAFGSYPCDGDSFVLWAPGGISVRVAIVADDEPRGTFTDEWSADAIANPDYYPGSNRCRYYRTEWDRGPRELAADFRSEYGRHDAYLRALSCLRAEARRSAEGGLWGVVVTVTAAGNELARESLWGIDVSESLPWLDLASVARDVIAEALWAVQPDEIDATARALSGAAHTFRAGVSVAALDTVAP